MSEQANDPVEMTDDQLDSLLEQAPEGDTEGSLGLEFGDVEVVEPEAEAEGEEGAEEAADEGEPEEVAESDDSEVEAEEDKADDEESDSSLPPAVREQMEGVLRRLEVMEADRDRVAAELEKERLLRDRNAGKLGALMQQLKETRDADRADGDEFGTSDDADERQSKPKSEAEEALDEIRAEKVQRSIQGAAQDFWTANEGFFNALETEVGAEASERFQADLVEKVRAQAEDAGEDLTSMSPKMAARYAGTMMKAAYAELKMELIRDYQQQVAAEARKSSEDLKARKKGAAGVRSNKRAPVSAKSRTKSLSQMSDAELEQALAQASFD